MIRNPFPGPQPYRAAERRFFYGRGELSYALQSNILSSRCVTVYGPSGCGKSSLLQASVLPTLIEAHDASVARVDAWLQMEDPTNRLANALHSQLGFGRLPTHIPVADAVLMAAQRSARRSTSIMIVYLDQLEQLFYSGRAMEQTDAFFECLERLVELPIRNVRLVLSLREDYLGQFHDRLRDRSTILDHGFRVGRLNVAELTDAVCQGAAAGDPPQIWQPEQIRPLILDVRVPGEKPNDEAEVQSAYAQIVCRTLFEQQDRGSDIKDSIKAEPILQSYLETTLKGLENHQGVARQLLEEHFVATDGSRVLRIEKELLQILPAEALLPCLQALEGAAVLHAEEHQGSRYYEIGHDWLATWVFEQRRRRKQEEQLRQQREEAERQLAKQRQEAEARLAKERADKKASRNFAVMLGAIALVMAVLAAIALKKQYEADLQRIIADQRRDEAQDARILAGFRELRTANQLPFAMKLLAYVKQPAAARGWVELASNALHINALRVTLRGHRGPLTVATFSPDGKHILTASHDGTARVWNTDGTGEPTELKVKNDTAAPGVRIPINFAAFSPDGQQVVAAYADGTARLWRADGTGQPVVLESDGDAARPDNGPMKLAVFSPDGKHVVTASTAGTARVWNADGAGQPVVLEGHKGALTYAVFHPDGRQVFTASTDKTVRLWQAIASPPAADTALRPRPERQPSRAPLQSGVKYKEFKGHTKDVNFLALSSDGKQFVTVSDDRTARVWDIQGEGKPIVLEGHEGAVTHAAFSPDGRYLATASADRTARVWNANGQGDPVVLQGHTATVVDVSFSPDGNTIATASTDKTARLWSRSGGDPVVLRGHKAPLQSIEWSPDGNQLVTAADTAKVWSASLVKSFRKSIWYGPSDIRIAHTAFISADHERVVLAYDDKVARLFRLNGDDKPIEFQDTRADVQWVASATLSMAGDRVVTASFDNKARIFRIDKKADPIVLIGHTAAVRFAAFSPDGTRVVTVSDDKTARVFLADGTGTPIVLQGHQDWLTFAAWSRDGKRIITTSLDHTARVWNADGSGSPIILSGHQGDVLAATFDDDGKRIVTTSEDHTARIWNADTGEAVGLRKHHGPVLCVVFSQDGGRIATSSVDGTRATIRIWDLTNKGEPIVLRTLKPVTSLAFLDNGQNILGVAGDGSTYNFSLSIANLSARLEGAHRDCLPPDLLKLHLFKTNDDARKDYEVCEIKHGRKPFSPDHGLVGTAAVEVTP